MYSLSEEQIDFILNDIGARGVKMEELQLSLLDHVCCIIENQLEADGNFEQFYNSTIKTFYKEELWEIEEETIHLLLFKNYYLMKKTMIISGTLSVILLSAGILFKFMHWAGASAMIVLGIFISSFVFLPLMFTLKAKEKQKTKDKITIGIGALAGMLALLSVLFKIMHWPGANLMGVTFLILMIAVYIPLYLLSGIKNPDAKVNTITTSILMFMGCSMFLVLINSRPYIQERSAVISNSFLQESYNSISKEIVAINNSDSTLSKTQMELHAHTEKLCSAIEKLKLQLVLATEGVQTENINYETLGKMDNYDIPTFTLFSENEKPKDELAKLKADLYALNSFCKSALQLDCSKVLDLGDKPNLRPDGNTSWESRYFYKTPLVNVLRNFTQLQINLRCIEMRCKG